MHNHTRSVLLICLLAYAPATRLNAVTIHPNAGTTSAGFLKLGIGSRATAMGGAFTALSDDASALYWNPAGLAQLREPELLVVHNESFESIRHDAALFAQPLRRRGVFAAGLYGLYTPNDIERRSGLNETDPYEPLSPVEGYFQSYDIALHQAYARSLGPRLDVGAGLKLIRQTIDTESAYGAALDLGIIYRHASLPLTLGFAAQHMGAYIKFRDTGYPLPTTFRAGACWRWNRKLLTTLDVSQPIDNYLSAAAAAEYSPTNVINVRAAYRYRWYGLELGDLSGLSCGVGCNFKLYDQSLSLDYAFLPFGVLGNSHRLSVGIRFNAPAPAVATAAPRDKSSARTLTTLPNLPAAPVITPAPDASEGFSYYSMNVFVKPLKASRAFSTSAIQGKSEAGGMVFFEGKVNKPFGGQPSVEVGEKDGSGGEYRHFTFRKNFPFPVLNVRCRLRIPKGESSGRITLENGSYIPLEIAEEDEKFTYYRFSLDVLQPFTVMKK